MAAQKRRTSSGVSSTRNAQPWLNPALGARTALASARSIDRRVDRLVAVVADHAPAADDLLELHGASMRISDPRPRDRRAGGAATRGCVGWGRAPLDDFERMWSDLAPVGRSATSGGYFRQPFTQPERELADWFRGAGRGPRGLRARVRRHRQPRRVVARRRLRRRGVLTGSHLDSVLDGGAYDGPLGVVSALAAIDELRSRGVVPARPIGVSVFVEEEGSRFGLACLGSRLAAGAIDLGPGAGAARPRRRRASRRSSRAAGRGCSTASGSSSSCTSSRAATWSTAARRSGWPARSGRTAATASTSRARPTTPGSTRMEDRADPMLTYAMTALAANKQARLAGQRATFGRVEVTPNGTNAVPVAGAGLAGRAVLVGGRRWPSWSRRSPGRRPSAPRGTGRRVDGHRRVGVRARSPSTPTWPAGSPPTTRTATGRSSRPRPATTPESFLRKGFRPRCCSSATPPASRTRRPRPRRCPDCLAGVHALAETLERLAT